MPETETHRRATAATDARVELPITGMTCAACARRIERKLTNAEGVSAAHVNFATARATVAYDPARTNVGALVETVRAVGYDTTGARTDEDGRTRAESEEAARAAELRALRRRFIVAAVLSAPVLIIAMAHG